MSARIQLCLHNTPFPCLIRPEAFGQHPNAEISYLIEDSKALLDGLLGLAPRGGSTGSTAGGSGRRREELVEAIANDLLDQVPAPFNLEAVMKAKQDDPSALHVVLFQEVGGQLCCCWLRLLLLLQLQLDMWSCIQCMLGASLEPQATCQDRCACRASHALQCKLTAYVYRC